jgi:hypothetical protein
VGQTAVKHPIDPAAPRHKKRTTPPLAQLDLSMLNNLLKLAAPQIEGSRVHSAEIVAPGQRPVAGVSMPQRPVLVPQPASARPQTTMAGPRHTEFVAQENARVRPLDPHAFMLMRLRSG